MGSGWASILSELVKPSTISWSICSTRQNQTSTRPTRCRPSRLVSVLASPNMLVWSRHRYGFTCCWERSWFCLENGTSGVEIFDTINEDDITRVLYQWVSYEA